MCADEGQYEAVRSTLLSAIRLVVGDVLDIVVVAGHMQKVAIRAVVHTSMIKSSFQRPSEER